MFQFKIINLYSSFPVNTSKPFLFALVQKTTKISNTYRVFIQCHIFRLSTLWWFFFFALVTRHFGSHKLKPFQLVVIIFFRVAYYILDLNFPLSRQYIPLGSETGSFGIGAQSGDSRPHDLEPYWHIAIPPGSKVCNCHQFISSYSCLEQTARLF